MIQLRTKLEQPLAAALIAVVAMLIALGVAFTVIKTQAGINERARAASERNCANILRLRDAAVAVIEDAGAETIGDTPESAAMQRIYSNAADELRAVRCLP